MGKGKVSQYYKKAMGRGNLFPQLFVLYKIRASHFVQIPQTLPVQLTQSRLPCGTQKVPLSAAAFLP